MQVIFRIIGMAWRYKARLGLAYATNIAAVFFGLSIPWILGKSIDRLVVRSDDGQIEIIANVALATLVGLGAVLLVMSVVRGLFQFGRTYTSDSLSQKVSYDLRNAFYDKLQRLSFAYHDKEHTGNLMSKATADVEAVRRFVMMGMVRSVEIGLAVIAIPFFLLLINWELALMILWFLPFVVYRATVAGKKMRNLWDETQIVMGESVTVMQENLEGMQVVKTFAAEEHEGKKFAEKAQLVKKGYFESERLQGTESAWMTLFFAMALVLILWYGGWEVIRGDLSPGGLAMFILYLNYLAFPVRSVSFVISTFSRAAVSGRRLFDVLDARSSVEESPTARDMGKAVGQVCLEDVSFSYSGLVPSLKNINVSVAPGLMVVLLGAPGSGKSTIANLLPRFYDATEGRVIIDGTDIKEFTLASLRRNVGVVQQDVFLFSGTVKENIAYGAADSSLEEIIRATKVAQLHDHIMSLPDQYDTWVGERGSTLSGGQRQRLSIARTILMDPPVLILDDSTSSVDVETEQLIHGAMTQLMKGRTTFVIAHRLSTVRQADMVLVLSDGEIVERGAHEELMSKGGIYRDIYELQLRPSDEVLLDAQPNAQAAGATGSGGDS